MPRRPVEGKPIKRRSRGGCHNCKRLKIKCDEFKPICHNCVKYKATCDYSLKLSWGGRPYKKPRLDSTTAYTLTGPSAKSDDQDSTVNIGIESINVPFKEFASKFVAAPLEKKISSNSFIIENPSIHYSSSESLEQDDSMFSTMHSCVGLFDLSQDIIATPKKPLSESSPADPKSDVTLLSTPLLKQEANESLQPNNFLDFQVKFDSMPADQLHLFEIQTSPGTLDTTSDNILKEFKHDNLQNTNIHSSADINLPYLSNTSTEPAISRDDNLITPSLFDDPSFANFDLSDFTKDFEVSENNNLMNPVPYKTALMQVALRDQVSSDNSPDSSQSVIDLEQNTGFSYIPRPIELIPDMLKEVPIYRDLFHHFIHVTADIMVPAPLIYPQNPFKTILPAMALGTPHLLALILAFSAYHRARYLRLPSPTELLGRLLSRVFQGLTKALESEQEAKSDVTLTTAIMLSSYDMLTETVNSSWKKHLHGARDIVIARGLSRSLMLWPDDSSPSASNSSCSPYSDQVTDLSLHQELEDDSSIVGPRPLGFFRSDLDESDITFFLIRWFAYFDVVGALCSSHGSAFMSANENMAQLWAIHDWSLARMKEDVAIGIPASENKKKLFPASATMTPNTPSGDPDNSVPQPINVDLLLGLDLDMMPVISRVSYLTRQRRRLNKQKARKEKEKMTPLDFEKWKTEWSKLDQELSSESFELGDLILSFCESYEVRRKQYVNNYIAAMMAGKCEGTPQDPNNSFFFSLQQLDSDIEAASAYHSMLPIQVQTYSQLCAMNTTFCYSALIQLYRRAIELPTSSHLVQEVVSRVTRILDTCIPLGSRVESCMSFPIFATACEVIDPLERDRYRMRMKGMERFGVGQVFCASKAMELTWERNVPWVDIMEENNWEFVFA